MSESKLPSASIENDFLRLEYLTTTGPRIIGLYAKGVERNLFAETPDVHWPVPHGEFYLRGGHRLWKAPEDSFYNCPEEGLTVIEGDGVTLRSPVDTSGLEKEITFRLDGNRVHLSHRITWHGESPLELAPWTITQLRLNSLGILPMLGVAGDDSAPNRSIVIWPYASLKDERLELHDDFVLVHGQSRDVSLKVGGLNAHGWLACALGDALFVKRFVVENGMFPDMNSNVEAYVKDVCIELELLGTLRTLKNGESAVMDETWEVIAGEFPANVETARVIGGLLKNN
jgi:hypothetical protein